MEGVRICVLFVGVDVLSLLAGWCPAQRLVLEEALVLGGLGLVEQLVFSQWLLPEEDFMFCSTRGAQRPSTRR